MADPEAERSELMELLRIAEDRRWHHHTALWEEEKHFTWWIGLIFPALFFVQTNRDLTPHSRLFLMIAGIAFGMFVSIVALRVFRREGESFVDTMQMLNRIVHLLGLHRDATYTFVEANERMAIIRRYKTTITDRNKPLWVLCLWILLVPVVFWWLGSRVNRRWKGPEGLGVRDCFQVLFIGAIVLFICFAVWGLVTHGRPQPCLFV